MPVEVIASVGLAPAFAAPALVRIPESGASLAAGFVQLNEQVVVQELAGRVDGARPPGDHALVHGAEEVSLALHEPGRAIERPPRNRAQLLADEPLQKSRIAQFARPGEWIGQ